MPVIVDEIGISVEVANQAAGGSLATPGALPTEERQGLVSDCVERVLEILRRERER